MKYLFVGGPRHGEKIEVRDHQPTVITMGEMPDMRATWATYHDMPLDTLTIKTVEYRRRDIGTDRIIYVADR